jgi:methyl acetate hydrolase
MKRCTTILALISAIAIGVLDTGCASQTWAPSLSRLSEAGTAALSQQLAAAVTRGDTPGVVALLVDRDGVLYEGSAGKLDVAGNVPMISDAIFRIASMTKPITSVAIMMLVEEGKLGLDDSVSRYLAGFENLLVITAL